MIESWGTWIALASLVISICAVGVSFFLGRRANATAERGLDSGRAALEASLRGEIRTCSALVQDAVMKVAEIATDGSGTRSVEDKDRLLRAAKLKQRAAIEDYLNAFEFAAGKYLDGQVNEKRFRLDHRDEVKNLCEQETYAAKMQPEDHCKYRGIWRLYGEWHRGEHLLTPPGL